MKRKPTAIQLYVRAKLDEPLPPKPVIKWKFKPVKAVKDGAEFRRKPKQKDPLKLLKRIL